MPSKKSKTTPTKKLMTKLTKKSKTMIPIKKPKATIPTKKSKAITYKYDNNNKYSNKELVKLILKLKKANKDTRKSQNNLPARIMRLNTPQIVSYTEQISPMGKSLKISKSKSYSKAVNSTFSSLTHNGHTHSKGKKIINESTKPFLKVDEMHNGKVHQYMIPKNSIPYKQKLQLEMPRMQELEMPRIQDLEMPRMQELEMPKTTYVVLSRKGKTSMKPKHSTNTNNLMLHNLFTS